jgi:hypothetical protein
MVNAYTKIIAEQLAKKYPDITIAAIDPGW